MLFRGQPALFCAIAFLKKREGLFVQIKCGEHEGWGEIALLPEI